MNSSLPFLPYGRQFVDDDDIRAVTDALRGKLLTTGPLIDLFEKKMGQYLGARHAIAVSNGTAALHLAALALRLGPGDQVIVPSITFVATANAARYVGADVVFADVNPQTGIMDPVHLLEALARASGPVKAVFPVHLAGQVSEISEIYRLSRDHNLQIVEDACHALGTTYAGNKVGDGYHADISIFSFHPVKTLTTGEGGLLTTSNDDLAARLRLLRNHGLERNPARWTQKEAAFETNGTPNPWYYEMLELGLNYRLTDFQCALGLSQLDKLAGFIQQRRHLVSLYDELLAPLKPLVRQTQRTVGTQSSWHLYIALFDFAKIGLSRSEIMKRLHSAGIGSQVHYIPVHMQPYYQRRNSSLKLPGAETYYSNCLSLPLFVGMQSEDVERVVQAVSDIIRK